MTMRQRYAEVIYLIKSNNCLVPFAQQGEALRAECYAGADVLLDMLTVPPSRAMLEAVGLAREGRGIETRAAEIVWETMVRAMIEEGRK